TAAFTEAFVHFASLIRPVGKIDFPEGDEPSVSKTSRKNRTGNPENGNPGDGNPEFDLRRDKPHGAGLVIQESIHITTQKKSIAKCTYGLGVNALFRARDVRVEQGDYCFDFIYAGQFLGRFRCGLPGHHNVQNTLAALGICHGFLGLPIKELQEGIASFKGAKRRFETVVNTAKHIVIDDYAHHPEEIKAIVHSVQTLYPNKHITGLFQPHLFSRTKDFAREFADSLSALDTVWLMDIYPARENPIPGITSTWLLEMIQNPRKRLLSADQIHTEIYNSPPELLLILGAGDIDRLIEPIRKQYEEISTSHQ
ncbi:MAG: Mur ligase family protein, partial [Bacteroidetes bacterium]|nr:Mur ligase family protein [Bacteroidota bacterium]